MIGGIVIRWRFHECLFVFVCPRVWFVLKLRICSDSSWMMCLYGGIRERATRHFPWGRCGSTDPYGMHRRGPRKTVSTRPITGTSRSWPDTRTSKRVAARLTHPPGAALCRLPLSGPAVWPGSSIGPWGGSRPVTSSTTTAETPRETTPSPPNAGFDGIHLLGIVS